MGREGVTKRKALGPWGVGRIRPIGVSGYPGSKNEQSVARLFLDYALSGASFNYPAGGLQKLEQAVAEEAAGRSLNDAADDMLAVLKAVLDEDCGLACIDQVHAAIAKATQSKDTPQ